MDFTRFGVPSSPLFSSSGDRPSLYGTSKGNPFAVDNFSDPLCKLNLKETSEFVKSLPMPPPPPAIAATNAVAVPAEKKRDGVNTVTQRRMEAPSTPGRPVFSFSAGNLSRKSFPSKWDDAEKWVISSSCHDSPAHPIKPAPQSKQYDSFKQRPEIVAEKSRVTEEKVSAFQGSVLLDHHHLLHHRYHHDSATAFNGVSASTDVLLKDKFTDKVEPVLPDYQYSEPLKEGFLFRNSGREAMKDAGTEVKHRDAGTEMTPIGSSTTSRCNTPFKSSSPARHNTPANRSGPLALTHSTSANSTIDMTELQECHLAKLKLGTQYDSMSSYWNSREEEEEEISKSLRHFETGNWCRKSVSDSRVAAWVDEEKTKCCLRYQREEAKIQAWLNLQTAKAEAQSRKLEVKIQKMRSNLEEKLMKRMAIVHRKTEEWRASARQQHKYGEEEVGHHQIIHRHNYTVSSHRSSPSSSCGCFPSIDSIHHF